MGTPRASASVDQMRNVQKSASRGGECTVGCGIGNSREREGAAIAGAASSCRTGAIITSVWWIDSGAAAGFTGFCCGKTHDFIVAQQSAHPICWVTLEPIAHSCAGAWKGTATRATRRETPTRRQCFTEFIGSTNETATRTGNPVLVLPAAVDGLPV